MTCFLEQPARRHKLTVMVIGVVALLSVATGNAQAQVTGDPGLACRAAIRQAEVGSGLPANLLGGIARVESGRRDPATGHFTAWPWTINAEGRGRFFDTKSEAIAYARELRGRGVQSFDVGCLQVNLLHHPEAFASLEDAFDPLTNARYAVHFLQTLKDKLGNWDEASAWYHSANPELGVPYRGLVVNAMALEAKEAPVSAPPPVIPSQPTAIAPVAFSGVLSRPGNVMMLPKTGVMIAAGGQGLLGRGLDAYRAQPVAIVGIRTLASR